MAKPINDIVLQPSHVKALRFVEKYIKQHVFSPKIDEIGKGIGLTGRSAYRIVSDLCTLGYLTKEKRQMRSIKLTGKPLQ